MLNAILEKDSKEEIDVVNKYDFKSNVKKIEELIISIENISTEVGTEGMITRIVTAIADILIGLIMNFKAVILRGFRDLKRSELEAYIDSNKTNTMVIRKSRYIKFSDVDVASFPFISNKTEMVKEVSELIDRLKFNKRVKDINKVFIDIYDAILNNHADKLNSGLSQLSSLTDVTLSNNIFNMVKSNIKDKLDITAKFGDMFSSMKDFNDYIDSVKKNADSLNECVESVKFIEKKIYPVLDKIVENLTKNPDRMNAIKSTKDFSKLVYDIAYLFDSAGHIYKHYSKLEHNIVNIFKVLKSNV